MRGSREKEVGKAGMTPFPTVACTYRRVHLIAAVLLPVFTLLSPLQTTCEGTGVRQGRCSGSELNVKKCVEQNTRAWEEAPDAGTQTSRCPELGQWLKVTFE